MSVLMRFLALSFLVFWSSSCADEPQSSSRPSKGGIVGDELINNFAQILSEHPEVGPASLKQIKTASGLSLSTQAPKHVPNNLNNLIDLSLSKEVAKEAQLSIDNMLSRVDLEAQLEAGLKIVGISFNTKSAINSDIDNPSLPVGNIPPEVLKLLTCEEFMKNPLMGISESQLTSIIQAQEDLLKGALSGCQAIKAEQFLTCMKDLNSYAKAINEHVTCNVKSFAEVDKILQTYTNKTLTDLNNSATNCLVHYFAKCGYDTDKIDIYDSSRDIKKAY